SRRLRQEAARRPPALGPAPGTRPRRDPRRRTRRGRAVRPAGFGSPHRLNGPPPPADKRGDGVGSARPGRGCAVLTGGGALKPARVLQETLDTVERAKEEIFYIAEDARRELEETRAELERVRSDVDHQIGEVDRLQREDRQARLRLMEVTREFKQRSEEEVRSAYERAKDVQTLLQVALERERNLRRLRDSLERRLRRLQQTVQRAESLVSQVSVAIKVLAGNLSELAVHVEGARLRQALGVSIVRAQEEERRRLARDIHDGPAQLLANVAFRIEMCERLLDTDLPRVREELARLGELVRQSLQDVRKIIFGLRPMALDDLGLAPAV